MSETVYFSPSTCGAYYLSVHGVDMPSDVVKISEAEWQAVLSGLSSGAKVVSSDEAGYPVLIDPPPLAMEELEALERLWRDAQLAASDPLVSRHRDEIEEGVPTTLTAEQYVSLQAYRRALRDWPQGGKFPLTEHRPAAPTWLAEQIL